MEMLFDIIQENKILGGFYGKKIKSIPVWNWKNVSIYDAIRL